MALARTLLSVLKHTLLPLRIQYGLRHESLPFIVEVGANDGKTGDPIYRLIKKNKRCHALLIEPIPYLFKRLQSEYGDLDRCILENVAIGPSKGTQPIYYITPDARNHIPELPAYFEELASFDKQRILSSLGETGEPYLREHLVETIPLSQLLEKHSIKKVDLLQIDTEGYDYKVLKTFPLTEITPRLICFEHCHLNQQERNDAVKLMAEHDYSVRKWGKDFVCEHRNSPRKT